MTNDPLYAKFADVHATYFHISLGRIGKPIFSETFIFQEEKVVPFYLIQTTHVAHVFAP